MEEPADLCLAELVAGAYHPHSPFDRMIVLGWFDGPTKGIAICKEHDIAYGFHTLAEDDGSYDYDAWDQGREIQIIGLVRLDPVLFAKMIEMLSETKSPRWPVWHRGPYQDLAVFEANSQADTAANAVIDQIDQLEQLDVVMALQKGDLLKKVLTARRIEPGMDLPQSIDGWFSFMGYSLEGK